MIQSESIQAKKIATVAERIYKDKLRQQLELHHEGEIVVIDAESGDYFLGESLQAANEKARIKYPEHVFYAIKVGFPAVYSFGSHEPISTYP